MTLLCVHVLLLMLQMLNSCFISSELAYWHKVYNVSVTQGVQCTYNVSVTQCVQCVTVRCLKCHCLLSDSYKKLEWYFSAKIFLAWNGDVRPFSDLPSQKLGQFSTRVRPFFKVFGAQPCAGRGKGKHGPISKKLDILVFSSLRSASTGLCPKNFLKRAHPILHV